VQLAGALVDMTSREIIASPDVIVRRDGWIIPDEGVAVHGNTNEHAAAVGIPESLALSCSSSCGAGASAVPRPS
jgi:DNA polymerase-3 subunit epsilon